MRTLPIALAFVGALASGCSSPCGEIQSADDQCGTAYNQSKCEDAIGQCTSADTQTISTAASCLENSSVCANGSVVDDTRFLSCVLPLSELSSSCKPL